MKSFGLWYSNQKSEDREINKTEEKTKSPCFCLHVNFWSLEDYKHIKSNQVPCLDIGIKIENYQQVDEMTFYCPFNVEDEEILDLASKMESKNNANIIFNEDCEIHTTGNYTIVERTDDGKMLIFPLNQVIKDVYRVERNEYGTYLKFKFEKFLKYVMSSDNSKLGEIGCLYIRFRIVGNTLRKNIYFDSEPLNKSFESAFSGTRMIDFKINEKRNIAEKVRAEIIVQHETFVSFKSVHFLVMEPSAYDITAFDNQEMSCRELEEQMWDDYFGEKIDLSKGHILAYHWKQKEEKTSYSCLIKVKYSKARLITIISYALIVVALGIISSVIVTVASIIWPNNWLAMMLCGVGGLMILLIAVYLGNKSK